MNLAINRGFSHPFSRGLRNAKYFSVFMPSECESHKSFALHLRLFFVPYIAFLGFEVKQKVIQMPTKTTIFM